MKDPKEPFHLITEKEGETLYCACGRSKSKPYCDGSHGGTGISPWRMVLPKSRQVKICGCGKTGIGPFCDDSHAPRRAAKESEASKARPAE